MYTLREGTTEVSLPSLSSVFPDDFDDMVNARCSGRPTVEVTPWITINENGEKVLNCSLE